MERNRYVDNQEDDEVAEELSLKRLLSIICCPPLPSHIGNKLAFVPSSSTYSLKTNGPDTFSLVFNEKCVWKMSESELSRMETRVTKTSSGNNIVCCYFKICRDPTYTILFSHGNAVDIGNTSGYLLELGLTLKVNIMTYDYSGYGCSTGKASESNTHSDILAAFILLQNVYNTDPSKIILYGQSIGSVPTIHHASMNRCAGVVLHSAISSGLRVLFPKLKRHLFCDVFRNIEKVTKIDAPVLIIHGTNDEIVSISHGLALYDKTIRPVKPLWIDGAGHNDIEFFPEYFYRLKQFINVDLRKAEQTFATDSVKS